MGILQVLKTQLLCHLIICYVFLVSGFIINLLQLCTLPLWYINKQLARRINCRLGYSVSSQLVALLEWWSGTECTLYTDPESYPFYGKENAIVVLNHNFEIDFMTGWTFCERFGVLGSSKVLAKKELSFVPVIGWMWYFLEIVFCKRKWEEDRKTVVQSLHNLRDYPEYFWFLLHCEGTRFTEKKHKISMEVAEKKGQPKLKYHLLPRTKGFCVTVQNLRGTGESFLAFKGTVHLQLLVPIDLHIILLCQLTQDEFQEHYRQTGRFPGPITSPPRRPWALLNWLFWVCLLVYPLCMLLLQMLLSESTFTVVCTFVFCLAVSVGIRWMIGQTEIDKGSNYGNKEMQINNN
uniref:1-acylglycerol-3-phosphate O-acyltransferase n=1 Tax=Sinocyclocheilus anshuiensis TaxID=1608454 RepID=A0A671SBD9_9TELE